MQRGIGALHVLREQRGNAAVSTVCRFICAFPARSCSDLHEPARQTLRDLRFLKASATSGAGHPSPPRVCDLFDNIDFSGLLRQIRVNKQIGYVFARNVMGVCLKDVSRVLPATAIGNRFRVHAFVE